MNAMSGPLEDYALQHTKEAGELIGLVEGETSQKSAYPQMMVGKVEGTLLKLLVRMSNSKRVLEIGTFTGYSALTMASSLPDDGQLITLEISEKHARIAQGYFDRSSCKDKIKLIVGDARSTIQNLEGPFDMIFIDADKESYDLYYEKSYELLKPGGIMVLDNMLWSGLVLSPEDEESEAIHRLNEKIVRDDRVENVLLTVRDGIMLARKKDVLDPPYDGSWRSSLEEKTRRMVKRERKKRSESMDKAKRLAETLKSPQKPHSRSSRSTERGSRSRARK